MTSPPAPTLLTLPVELREQIYAHLFASYEIRHGFHAHEPATPSNRIALLLTCRQVHFEAWRHLPLNCTMVFRGTENMLEMLLSAGQAVVTRLRFVHVKSGYPFPLYLAGREYYPTYYAGRAVELVPGLCLDELVVEDCWHGGAKNWRDVATYFDIETLLQSSAWRTLIYITPSTDFLTSGYDARSKRRPQPQTWDAMLKTRDTSPSSSPASSPHATDSDSDTPPESDSDACVKMFLTPYSASTEPHDAEAQPQNWAAYPGNLVIADRTLATPQQGLKGVVQIVAKRSRVARPVQTGLSEARSWREVKGTMGDFVRKDWTPYANDMADAMGWVYGGWGRRMQMANEALGGCGEGPLVAG